MLRRGLSPFPSPHLRALCWCMIRACSTGLTPNLKKAQNREGEGTSGLAQKHHQTRGGNPQAIHTVFHNSSACPTFAQMRPWMPVFLALLSLSCRPERDRLPPVVTWESPGQNGALFAADEVVTAAVHFSDADLPCNTCTWSVELRSADALTLRARISGEGERAEVAFPPGQSVGEAWLAAVVEDASGNRAAGFRQIQIAPSPAPNTEWIVARNNPASVGGISTPWPVNTISAWAGPGTVASGRRGGLAVARMPAGEVAWSATSGGSAWTPVIVAMEMADDRLWVTHSDGFEELTASGQEGLSIPASAGDRLPRAMAVGGNGVWLALLEDQTASASAHIRCLHRTTGAQTAALSLPFPVWDIAPDGSDDAFVFLSPENGWNRIDAASGQVAVLGAAAPLPPTTTSAVFLPGGGGDLIACTTSDDATWMAHRETGVLDAWPNGSLASWAFDPGSGAWLALELTSPWHPADAALGQAPPPSTGRLIGWSPSEGWSVVATGLGSDCIALAVIASE